MKLEERSDIGSTLVIDKIENVTADYSPGKNVPWWVKFGSKLILARLPVPYAVWRKLGIFKHGRSDAQWSRERKFATECIDLAKSELGRPPRAVLELGPGDSFVGAIVSAAHGVQTISVVDVGDFASVDVEKYRPLIDDLERTIPDFKGRVDLSSRPNLLRSINATYYTNGLRDLATLPESSVELCYSLKVMEHVRRNEFADLMRLISKASTSPSVQRHVVDLHDHMGCGLNNLRFTPGFWENRIVSRSGFYTNRLRCSEIVEIARQSGNDVRIQHALTWPGVPIDRNKMNPAFRNFSDQDLKICMFDMILRK